MPNNETKSSSFDAEMELLKKQEQDIEDAFEEIWEKLNEQQSN